MLNLFYQTLDAVTQLPVIAQGAAGSALFAILSYFGRKFTKKASNSLSKFNRHLRKENLYRELIHKKHLRAPQYRETAILVSISQCIRYLGRGLIFLALGWFFVDIVPLSINIGALGFLFYVFRAVLWVDIFTIEKEESDIKVWIRIKEIETELNGAPDQDTLAMLKKLEL